MALAGLALHLPEPLLREALATALAALGEAQALLEVEATDAIRDVRWWP